jgi:hypothetical protein
MTASDRIRERKICETTVQILEAGLAAARGHGFSPEDEPSWYNEYERVDWVQSVGAKQFAIEVTLVEAMPGRREQVTHLQQLFEPLRAELDGKLPSPGVFQLVIQPGALSIFRKKQLPEVRSHLREWILRAAPSLEMKPPNHFVRATLAGIGLDVALYRFRTRPNNGSLRVAYSMPDDLRHRQRITIGKALKTKLPKLSQWQAKRAVAVLVVELNDIALSDEHCVGEMVVQELEKCTTVPNHLFVFDTAGYFWIAYKVRATDQMDRAHLSEIAAFDERELLVAG